MAGVGALVAFAIGLAASVGGPGANAARTSGASAWPPTERSSRFVAHGRVSCIASVKAQVQVGHDLTVRFTLHNRSKHPATVSFWVFSAGFVLKSPDGTSYDTDAPYESFPGIPPPTPRKIPAGATWHFRAISVPVRWRGPLIITPGCLGAKLHPLRVQVGGPWPSPRPSSAIGEVVAAAGHFFDHCLPQTPGVPVDGQITAPGHADAPMDARCSISISSEGTFLVAQALVLIPHGLSGVQIYQPYETLWPIDNPFQGTPSPPPSEAIAWEFVVTRDRAIPVAASSTTATCGGGGSFAWGGIKPDIELIPATCSSSKTRRAGAGRLSSEHCVLGVSTPWLWWRRTFRTCRTSS